MSKIFLGLVVLLFVGVAFEIKADSACQSDAAPKLLYDLLKCTPKYDSNNKECIQEYTCPLIDRPKNTCHFKGSNLQVGDHLDNEKLREIHRRDCTCSESLEFECPYLPDGCAEYWIGGYPAPRCYLRRKLGQECAAGQICPPFDGNAECQVNGKVYKEGESFQNPNDVCSLCVCDKGFDNKFEAPFCQTQNCTWTMFSDVKKMDQFCAPFYKDLKSGCCPESWICPTETDELHQDSTTVGDSKCRFGDKTLAIGDYLVQKTKDLGNVQCKCVLPPFLQCGAE